jgi:ribosomal protein S4
MFNIFYTRIHCFHQEYARMLYEKERRAYEYRLQKKELARERKRLEGEQQLEAERLMAGYKPESSKFLNKTLFIVFYVVPR